MNRLRAFAVFAAVLASSAALAACGGGGSSSGNSSDPRQIVDEATLKGVESGKFEIWGEFEVKAPRYGHIFYRISGPFQKDPEAELPEFAVRARLNGTIKGERIDVEAKLTLLQNKAYVGYNGTEYEVDPTTFNFVKSAIQEQASKQGGSGEESSGCQEAAGEIEPSEFIDDLTNAGSEPTAEGAPATRVTGKLNVPKLIDTVVGLAENPACRARLGGAGPLPSAAELQRNKDRVEEAFKGSPRVEATIGDDHLLHDFYIRFPLIKAASGINGESGPESLGFELHFTLKDINEEPKIEAPQNARPLSQLFLKLGVNPIELAGALSGEGLSGAGGLGGLLERFDGGASGGGGSGGGGSSGGGSGGGQQAYLECLQEAHTATDVQGCARLLQ